MAAIPATGASERRRDDRAPRRTPQRRHVLPHSLHVCWSVCAAPLRRLRDAASTAQSRPRLRARPRSPERGPSLARMRSCTCRCRDRSVPVYQAAMSRSGSLSGLSVKESRSLVPVSISSPYAGIIGTSPSRPSRHILPHRINGTTSNTIQPSSAVLPPYLAIPGFQGPAPRLCEDGILFFEQPRFTPPMYFWITRYRVVVDRAGIGTTATADRRLLTLPAARSPGRAACQDRYRTLCLGLPHALGAETQLSTSFEPSRRRQTKWAPRKHGLTSPSQARGGNLRRAFVGASRETPCVAICAAASSPVRELEALGHDDRF